MKRRDFFKGAGIFGCGFALGLGTGNLSKIKNRDNNSNLEQKSDWLPHIEISLCYHCNLNCAGCYHCAPIAPIYFMPLDIFEKDLEQMYKITQGKIHTIGLLGGEPLINKKREEYIEIARKYFKRSEIIVYTNGLLLNNMPNSFWETCKKNNVVIKHSFYPLYNKYPDLKDSYKKSEKYEVKLTSDSPRYKFVEINLNNQKLNNINKKYKDCKKKINCAVLDNGLLYPCLIIPSVKLFLNKYFTKHILPIDKNDILNIYKTKSIDEIFEFYNEPKNFCKYCNYNDKQRKLWRHSKRKPEEWYKVTSL